MPRKQQRHFSHPVQMLRVRHTLPRSPLRHHAVVHPAPLRHIPLRHLKLFLQLRKQNLRLPNILFTNSHLLSPSVMVLPLYYHISIALVKPFCQLSPIKKTRALSHAPANKRSSSRISTTSTILPKKTPPVKLFPRI